MTVERKYDLYSQEFKRDAYTTYAKMRQDDPVLHQASLTGEAMIWFFSSYEDVEAILKDERFIRDFEKLLPEDETEEEAPLWKLINNHMLNRDGADHRRLRNLVSMAFTPKRVRELRPRIEIIANNLIDGVEAQGRMDLMAHFAFHLPTIVILEMLGVPSKDREKFKVWSNALIAPALNQEEMKQAMQHLSDFTDYLRDLFERRRNQPEDDLLTALLQAEKQGDKLSESELFSTFVLLIVAGHETTVNLIGNAMLALWRNPEQLEALKNDPSLMPTAVEEFLRYDGSLERAMNRWAAEDIEYKGHNIKKGDNVILILGSANHDAEKFAGPDELDIHRHPNPHLGFGKGPHYCLGAPLARLETEIALNTLLARLSNLRPDIGLDELTYNFPPAFRGIKTFPVRWDQS